MPEDSDWMHEALHLAAYAAQQGEVPVGALLVYEGQKIAEGWNQPLSQHDPTAHAEIIALRQAGQHVRNYRLLNTTLYVTLEPCLMCVGAIIHARLSRVVFGAFDPKTGAVCSRFQLLADPRHNHQLCYTGGLLADESRALLQNFFKMRRK